MAVPGSGQTSRSDGKTALLYQFQGRDGTYHFAGEDHIDGVLIGSKWTINTLTYSFPASGSFYEGSGYEGNPSQGGDPAFHQPFNPQQQEATRYTLDLVASYTNLNFQEITETATVHADLRFSQTNWRGARGSRQFPVRQSRGRGCLVRNLFPPALLQYSGDRKLGPGDEHARDRACARPEAWPSGLYL